jgi:hypothetical protein
MTKDSSTGAGNRKKDSPKESEFKSAFDLEEEHWDKKKIIAGIVIFVLLLLGVIGAKMFLLPKSIARHIPIGPAVEGVSTTDFSPANAQPTPEKISLPTTDDLQKKISELQAQITHLNVKDIASSSPQVQQLIQQIQSLPNAPANAAKEACMQVCNRL